MDKTASEQAASPPADERAEEALLKRVLGYDYEDRDIQVDPETKKPQKILVKKRHRPSDLKALIFWLTNRRTRPVARAATSPA